MLGCVCVYDCVFDLFLSVVQEKPKPKTHIDLFDDEEEDGDIFKGSAPTSTQTKKEVLDKMEKPPEKKANRKFEPFATDQKNNVRFSSNYVAIFFLRSCCTILLCLDAAWGYFHIWSRN